MQFESRKARDNALKRGNATSMVINGATLLVLPSKFPCVAIDTTSTSLSSGIDNSYYGPSSSNDTNTTASTSINVGDNGSTAGNKPSGLPVVKTSTSSSKFLMKPRRILTGADIAKKHVPGSDPNGKDSTQPGDTITSTNATTPGETDTRGPLVMGSNADFKRFL